MLEAGDGGLVDVVEFDILPACLRVFLLWRPPRSLLTLQCEDSILFMKKLQIPLILFIAVPIQSSQLQPCLHIPSQADSLYLLLLPHEEWTLVKLR